MRWFRALILAGLGAVMLSACASGARSDFGLGDRIAAFPVGFPNVRFSVEDQASAQVLQAQISEGAVLGPDGRFDLIALSGGGANGAYAAGIMSGWTESGERPDFEVVTGVSTGALAAPFVFLGPAYDDRLREAYTGGQAAGLLQSRGVIALIGSGVFSSEPLRALIANYVDDALLQAVAAENRKGRLLIVATTDLDAQRGVLWNMGAIADHGGPEALALFREVLTASASIPGVFPPVMIQSQNSQVGEGLPETFEEMHVDGGVMNPFVALPQMMWNWRDRSNTLANGRIWVVVNGKSSPVFNVTRDAAPSVLGRSLDTALKANLRAVLAANAVFAARNGMSYNVTAIPVDFEGGNSLDFSPEAMSAVYDLGRNRMLAGDAWTDPPPRLDRAQDAVSALEEETATPHQPSEPQPAQDSTPPTR
jgi:predicted acylesterase/phospholipase RssA